MRPGLILMVVIFGVPLYAVSYRARVEQAVTAIESARRRATLSEKFCALTAEMDDSQWSRQCTVALLGLLGRLLSLPREFWAEFLPLLGQIVGVPVVLGTDEERLKRIVRRAMKAALREDKEGLCEESDDSSVA